MDRNKLIDELAVYDAESYTTLFSDTKEKYVIPLYQRAYAWTDVEIEQLIDDIYGHSGERYYIGSLIVHKMDGGFEVIDGQQRLTTLLLLLLALGLPVENTLSFACRKRADDTLGKFIDGREVPDEDLEQNLVRGRSIIAGKLSAERIDKDILIRKLTHLRLYRIQVPPYTDLNRYFEVMNTRGEQLEQHDILKATLMRAIRDSAVRGLFAKVWEACSDMTGYVQMHFDTATRRLLFGSYWNCLQKIDYHGLAGQEAEGPEVTIDEILSPGFKVRYDDGGRDERVRFESVIDFPYFLIHVLRVYIHAYGVRLPKGKEPQKLLDDKKLIREFQQVLRYGKTGRQAIDTHRERFSITFMECLLRCRFLFDQYIIKREYADEAGDGAWSLKQLEAGGQEGKKKAYFKKTAFRDKKEWGRTAEPRNKEITMLQSALRVSYTSPKVMHWITELLQWLYGNENEKGWHAYLQTIEKIAVDAVAGSFLSAGNRHMGVNTPHIVFNYLDYLLWKENKQKYADFVFEFRNSVEHWYPQHPSAGTFDTWGQEEVDDFGNLCIMQRNVNSRFSNMAPAAKKATYSQMIRKGSLKLRLMAERTGGGNDANARWRQECGAFGSEMIEKLRAACGCGGPAGG